MVGTVGSQGAHTAMRLLLEDDGDPEAALVRLLEGVFDTEVSILRRTQTMRSASAYRRSA
jgi:hypothetical protein